MSSGQPLSVIQNNKYPPKEPGFWEPVNSLEQIFPEKPGSWTRYCDDSSPDIGSKLAWGGLIAAPGHDYIIPLRER